VRRACVLTVNGQRHRARLDQTGASLPGVTIDLTSGSADFNAVSDARGAYRFDDVAPGPAELTYRLINFTVLRRNATVAAGQVVTLMCG
jgi:hypothetical protein